MSLPHNGYLVLPRLRVQNLNTISSPLTWGAPSVTAAIGFMHALQRRVPKDWKLLFSNVGMVIHDFEPQINGDYVKKFNLTRNPVGKGGETLGIIEEGRAHATVSLVFGVFCGAFNVSTETHQERADHLLLLAEGMRFAGGSIIPNFSNRQWPKLILMGDENEEEIEALRLIKRRLLPGFALISRDDVLLSHTKKLQQENPQKTALDAWLDLSRFNRYCVVSKEEINGEIKEIIEWKSDRAPGAGWLVPIPIGYTALSELYEPDQVKNARDSTIAFRFVESMYSIGQWCSPHRLSSLSEMLWSSHTDHDQGVYRCVNLNSMQQSN